MDTTSIIDKLQKLLNHERSARTIGNVAEAEAFAAKISELLFEQRISPASVPPNRCGSESRQDIASGVKPLAGNRQPAIAQHNCLRDST